MLTIEPKELAAIAVGGFGALQKWEELAQLIELVDKAQPRTILEIGLGKGGTLWAWSKISSVKHIISLDLPGGAWGGEEFPRTSATLQYIKDNSTCEISFIGGDSHNPDVIAKVKEILTVDPVDFLMIDGAHDYHGVSSDYANFAGLVRPGGILAFHDILPHDPKSGCEVEKFWNEVKIGKDTQEFCHAPLTWGGVGLIRV